LATDDERTAVNIVNHLVEAVTHFTYLASSS